MPELKRVLGLPTVTFIAIGFTIGGGVFVFSEIVLGIAGAALPVAYILAVIPVIIMVLPVAMLGSAMPCTGANYKYPSRMVSPGLAFTGIWIYVLASFFGQLPLYAISCAKYASLFMPGLNIELFAIGLLTFFFLINLLGIELAAWIQGIMVILLIAAMVFFGVRGLENFHPENFAGMFDKGVLKLLLGAGLLTFTYLGANGIIEIGGEIKEPGRVIPQALFIAYPVVTILYLLIAFAVTGALPFNQITCTKDPLGFVSKCVCGNTGFIFFITCGAILAILTTLNALFIIGTKSLLMIVKDEILPKWAGSVNSRFGTAHILLAVIWLFSVLGVALKLPIETLASYSALGGMIIFVPIMIASMKLPKAYPEAYENAYFKLKGFWIWLCPVVGFIMIAFFSLIIIADMRDDWRKIAFFVLFAVTGVAYYQLRKMSLKKRGVILEDIKGRNDLYE
jgi:APA family basic amino acid/polyamine antiporter